MLKQQVAVIMPVYNGGETMSLAIESVINQTYDDWHLYIIDDCSTDNTNVLLDKYRNFKKISIVNNLKNEGVARSRNKGIELAFQDVISFIDSDDEWLPSKLETQLSAINNNNKLICSSYNYIKNNVLNQISSNDITLSKLDFLEKKFRVCFSSIMIDTGGRKIYFQEVGHEDFLYLYDWLAIYDHLYVVEEPLVNYFVMESSLSSSKLKTIKWQMKILKIIFPHSLHKQFFYMLHYVYRGITFNRKLK